MTSLAFILNPLDRNGGSSATPAPVSTASKRPLPALAAAIAPSPFGSGWTNRPLSFFSLPGLAPLTTIAAHRLAMDATLQFAVATTTRSYDKPMELTQRKKQRLQYIAAKYANHQEYQGFHENGGAASPTTSSEDELSSCDDVDADGDHDHDEEDKPQSSKKKTRLCKEKGCTSLAVSRRSCVRHGGGSRCTYDGCTNGAKLRNRCFQHGGSTICLADGCESKAKRYGYCWSHGGGRICSMEGCVKVAAQGGSCWAHGGGNRCKLEGCSKRSYQKHGYYCKAHAAYNV